MTLGCSKNLVDTERLMARLESLGYRCAHDPEVATGEIAVINTCGFIGDAKEESINTILQFAERKTQGELKRLYVMGCLAERYRKDLEAEIPEVDKWFGKFDYLNLIEELKTPPQPSPQREGLQAGCQPRVLTTPRHYAYLKISEGCNRMCSYCAIPLITGRHTSVPMEELIREAEWMAGQGVKELNVIAQDLSSYGLDLYKRHLLPELINRLADIEGIGWIRLHYAYPTDFPYPILDVMRERENVCRYLDIALQHATDSMLSKMRRHITRAEQDRLLDTIRTKVPGICLRTTLLVGHPGETEADFRELCEWVEQQQFDRLGAFAYSEEDGTYAAKHYKDDIPEEVKQERVAEIMRIQQAISARKMASQVGKVLRVLTDRREGDYVIGRTEFDSPEVDCEVLIESIGRHEAPIGRPEAYSLEDASLQGKEIKIGEFYDVKIERAEEFDLYGKLWSKK